MPALVVTLIARRLAQEDDELGPRMLRECSGLGDPVPQRQRAFELGDGLGRSEALRRQTCLVRSGDGVVPGRDLTMACTSAKVSPVSWM